MKSLFILQLVCCVITAMLALQLAMASLQVRWKVWRYEISRWILVASMLFFSVHYLLQMIHGLRAQGTDVGAAFNILFYTPVAFAITLSIINIESTRQQSATVLFTWYDGIHTHRHSFRHWHVQKSKFTHWQYALCDARSFCG